MLELIKLRSQMLSGSLPADEMKDIKMKATSEIDTGNKLLGKVKKILNRCGCDDEPRELVKNHFNFKFFY